MTHLFPKQDWLNFKRGNNANTFLYAYMKGETKKNLNLSPQIFKKNNNFEQLIYLFVYNYYLSTYYLTFFIY